MDETFVCACGLTCCDCLFYSGRSQVYETAAELKRLIKEARLDVFLSMLAGADATKAIANHLAVNEREIADLLEPFKKMPAFLEVLEAIVEIQCKKTCREAGGCSMGGNPKGCEVLRCVRQRGYTGCWECSDREDCGKLVFQRRSYGETIAGNFRIIRDHGIEAVKSRGNRYYEWQRRLGEAGD